MLESQNVSAEEYERLKEAIMEIALIGDNAFLKTTPDEVKKFVTFVENTAPYDIVLDGLNVAFRKNSKNVKERAETVSHLKPTWFKPIPLIFLSFDSSWHQWLGILQNENVACSWLAASICTDGHGEQWITYGIIRCFSPFKIRKFNGNMYINLIDSFISYLSFT